MYPGALAKTRPDAAAVIMAGSGEMLTWRVLDERSTRLAHLFADRGLQQGDRVALVCENQLVYFEVFWAVMRSGLRLVPVNWHLAAEEAAYIVVDSGARALVTTEALGDLAAELDRRVDVDCIRLMAASPDYAVGTVPVEKRKPVPGYESYEHALAESSAEPLLEEPEGGFMFYSSGTTGQPKGIVRNLSGRSMRDPAPIGLEAVWGYDEHTVFLNPAPMYHSAPSGYSYAIHRKGGTVVVMERFDAEGALAAIQRYRATHGQFVPTMFVRMLRLDDATRSRYDLSSLRGIVHAAAPCPVEVKAAMIDWWGPIVHEYYGASEGNGLTIIRAPEWLEHKGSVGRPLSGSLHIVDEDGAELPVGEIGTVYFENSMADGFSYHGDEAKTAETRLRAGWSTVGDIGYVDDEGFLYLTDRRSFTIISGGVNIYPQEIENALVVHPAVADAAVFGVPDVEMGEQVKAVVQLLDPDAAGPEMVDELRAWCRDRLSHYKCPRTFEFTARLPRTETGKLMKRELQRAHQLRPSG